MTEESKTYSIPVPAELDARVRADMISSGFNSLSEYVRDALRARLELSARRRLEAVLARAAERGDFREVPAEVLDRLRDLARGEGAGVEMADSRTRRVRRRSASRRRPSEPPEQGLERVLDVLRTREAELRRRGVIHAAVFGSTVRGEATPTSDVDILVDIDPKRSLGVFEFVAIARYLEELIPRADVVERKALKPRIQERVLEEAVYAF